jgi:hypothetical protein
MSQENPDLHIEPGAVLFNLTFRVLSHALPSVLPLQLDDAVLPNAVWKTDGTECAVQNTPVASRRDDALSAQGGLEANVRPNPSSGDATLQIQAPQEGKARIVLMDAFGRWLGARDVILTAGLQDVALPEVKSFPAGVYLWKVYSKGQEAQGQLINSYIRYETLRSFVTYVATQHFLPFYPTLSSHEKCHTKPHFTLIIYDNMGPNALLRQPVGHRRQ